MEISKEKFWKVGKTDVLGFLVKSGNFSMYCKLWIPEGSKTTKEEYLAFIKKNEIESLFRAFTFNTNIYENNVYYNLNEK